MKTIKISRENLIDREFDFIEEVVEATEEKVNMDKELGDFLFKLFKKNINRLMGSHILTSINLIVLEDGEEYIASSESNEYEEMMNLTNLEEIA